MNSEVRGSYLDRPHSTHTKQARWRSSQGLCLAGGEKAGEQGTETEGKGEV